MRTTSLLTTGLLCCAVLLSSCKATPPNEMSWGQAKSHILPQFTDSLNTTKMPIIFNRLTAEMYIGYVIDTKDSYHFIMKEQAEEWGIDGDTLHNVALENLESISEEVSIEVGEADGHKYATIDQADGYSAVRILLPHVRQTLMNELGEPFAAAFPVRDFAIAWNMDFPLVEKFMEQVQTEYAAGDKYALTPTLHLVTRDSIDRLVERDKTNENGEVTEL